MNSPATPPRSSRWIYAPLIAVIVLAIGWTAAWFYAASRAEGVVNAWIEREARDGRTYTCDERQVSGFPFRIEVRCIDLTAQFRDPSGPIILKTKQLTAVAQIYQPDLIIAEVIGPMSINLPAAEVDYVADWRLLQASVRGRPRDLRRLSIVVDAPTVRTAQSNAQVARAARLEAHVRRNPESPLDKPVFDLAGRTTEATVALVPALAERPFNAEATGALSGVHDFAARPFRQRLRDWQAQGGRLDLTNFRLVQGDALAVAKGEIALSAQGRLDGRLNLTLAGLDDLIGSLLGNENGNRARGLLSGLNLLSRAELEGKRALAMPLVFRDGRVFLGPVPIGQIGPLF